METDYKNAILSCRIREFHPPESGGAKSSDAVAVGGYTSGGSACVAAAGKEYAKVKAKLQVATNDENYTHDPN